jgi:hypothetical protein
MTNNLNCFNCGQNVMVDGLKVYNKEWHCRTCIKSFGVSLPTANSILVYDDPVNPIPTAVKTVDMILKEARLKNK